MTNTSKGQWIKRWREYHRPYMTQRQLAELLGAEYGIQISRSAIGQYESELQDPRDRTLRALEIIFGARYPDVTPNGNKNSFVKGTPEGVSSLEEESGSIDLEAQLPFWGDIPGHFESVPPEKESMISVPAALAKDADAVMRVKGDSHKPEFRANDRLFIKRSKLEKPGYWNVCGKPDDTFITLRWVDDSPVSRETFDTMNRPTGPSSDYTFYAYVIDLQRSF